MKIEFLNSYSVFKSNRKFTIDFIESLIDDINKGHKFYICSSILYKYKSVGFIAPDSNSELTSHVFNFIDSCYRIIYNKEPIHLKDGLFGSPNKKENMGQRRIFLQEIIRRINNE